MTNSFQAAPISQSNSQSKKSSSAGLDAESKTEPKTESKRLSVLLIAERANPEYTSIPLRGWYHGQAIAKVADVHIVTQHWNGPAYVKAGFTNFTGLDTSIVHEPMKLAISALRGGQGKGWTIDTALSALEYYFFEYLLWKKFGSLIKSGKFDLVHRLIPSSPTVPSLIAARCKKAGIPFILGPLNGGLPWPKEFNTARRQENEWLSYLRDIYRLMPGYRSTREDAAAIMVGSQATLAKVAQPYREKCVYFPANAVDTSHFQRQRSVLHTDLHTDWPAGNSAGNRYSATSRPIKLIFVGRLVPYKGADMLIDAAAPLLKAGKLTLDIIGKGPQHSALAAQIKAKALNASVTLAGSIPHEQMQDRLSAADVFAFPSIREFGGAVVLEAMAVGLVPVVVDYGGPGEMVTSTVGFKVPLGTRDQIVSGFEKIFRELVAHPERIEVMGARSRQRVLSKFTWQVMARQTLDVYQWVLSGGSMPKPQYDYTG
jgi:glycosyltransferase involved in cell wall biosynthesis